MAKAWRKSLIGFGICGAALAPNLAHASAWTPPKGGELITTDVTGGRVNEAFSDNELYLEMPVTGRFSAVVAPRLEIGRTLDPNDTSKSANVWRGEALIAGKARVRQTAHTALSAQVAMLAVRSPGDPCTLLGEEARVLGGVSKGAMFAEAQGAYRHRSGGCHSEKLDLTLGWRPSKRWLGMGQAFLDRGRDGPTSATMQFSLVHFDKKGKGLQLGVRFRADEQGQGERAFVVSYWRESWLR